jgi:uroporphyrin-III C-methyltransferase/precorrin-2 dehydrogenase/sirohydrochlorin ferrochelatase
VFGRGGEEALALQAAGVPFEIVPGLTSAVAAPALAGIPVTHRGISAAVVTVSGHAEHAWAPLLERVPPQGATIVVLMGLGSQRQIAARLIAWGWRRDTPAAVIVAASTPRSRAWMGALEELANGAGPAGTEDAGTIVIGDVVRVGLRLRYAAHEGGELSASAPRFGRG